MDTQNSSPNLSAREAAVVALKKNLVVPYYIAIPGIPSVATAAVVAMPASDPLKWLAIFLAPTLFALTFVTVAGVLSMPHQANIVPGTFPRSLDHPVYVDRRLYGVCLTSVYYFTPIYAMVLYIPWFRKLFFILFGYRGNLDFTIHPDTWIRDLPLVSIGKGAYIANHSTIGTNIISHDNHIRVDRVKIGDYAVVGAHSLVAPGAVIGAHAEIGIRTVLGLRARIGEAANVGPDCAIGHDVILGDRVIVGRKSEIDTRSRVPADTNIAPFTRQFGTGETERA